MQSVRSIVLNPIATHLCAFLIGCILLKAVTANSVKVQTSLRQNVVFQIDGVVAQGEGPAYFLGTNANCILSDAPVKIIQKSDHPVYMISLQRAVEILKLISEHSIATLRWLTKKDQMYSLCYEAPKVIYGSL